MSDSVAYRKPQISQSNQGGSRGGKRKGRGGKSDLHDSTPAHPAPAARDPFAKILTTNGAAGDAEIPSMTHLDVGKGKLTSDPAELEPATSVSGKKQPKYIPLFQAHGHDLHISLPGRHPCQCMCTKHDLVTNCLNCGRIVCEQEGAGPCFTCGQLVCTPQQRSILARGGIEANKLKRQLEGSSALSMDFDKMLQLNSQKDEAQQEAEAQRDKLLEFERTSAQRTKVIDDQADYYSVNQFMTKAQRELVRKKEEELRKVRFQSPLDKNRTFELDFAGRQLRREGVGRVDEMYTAPDPEVLAIVSGDTSSASSRLQTENESSRSAQLKSLDEELAFIPSYPAASSQLKVPRIQDRELQEMSDTGATLSVLQPWASFIVMGLKPHEGRDWYTAHRGKLWITSGMKLMPANEIIEEENLLKALVGDDWIVFPEQYLTGFMLGSVDLVDCITQEEYKRRFPGGLLQSPYVFLLSNPVELERKFPVEGKGKIFKMDPKLHHLAKSQSFRRPDRIWRPEESRADDVE